MPCLFLNVSHSNDVFCMVDTLSGPSNPLTKVSKALAAAGWVVEEEEEDDEDEDDDDDEAGTIRSISVMPLPNRTVSITVCF
jgi:hypothetical protein